MTLEKGVELIELEDIVVTGPTGVPDEIFAGVSVVVPVVEDVGFEGELPLILFEFKLLGFDFLQGAGIFGPEGVGNWRWSTGCWSQLDDLKGAF